MLSPWISTDLQMKSSPEETTVFGNESGIFKNELYLWAVVWKLRIYPWSTSQWVWGWLGCRKVMTDRINLCLFWCFQFSDIEDYVNSCLILKYTSAQGWSASASPWHKVLSSVSRWQFCLLKPRTAWKTPAAHLRLFSKEGVLQLKNLHWWSQAEEIREKTQQ